jgi:hypothetical protein
MKTGATAIACVKKVHVPEKSVQKTCKLTKLRNALKELHAGVKQTETGDKMHGETVTVICNPGFWFKYAKKDEDTYKLAKLAKCDTQLKDIGILPWTTVDGLKIKNSEELLCESNDDKRNENAAPLVSAFAAVIAGSTFIV